MIENGLTSSSESQVLGQESLNNGKQVDLFQVIFNSYDSILVTNKDGYVILANPSTERMLGIPPEKLIGQNVRDLVKNGVYDRSVILRAMATKSIVTGLIKSGIGLNLMVTSTPILDENGEIKIVVSNARDRDVMDKFFAALEEEKSKAVRYKSAMEYLSSVDIDPKIPVAESWQMREIIMMCNVIAKTDSTIMITGESGTGKEVIARYIHRYSQRANEPFIPVNCAAIPHELLESEFFGYVRGAFTGASLQGKPGLFEIADNGTIFLDEIAELPLAMQSKLLRVLETGEVQRLGGTTIYQTNVRLIAATNRDLKSMINENLFRSDLYYRLNVIPINLPPLRERPKDIVALASRFIEEYNRKYGLRKEFSSQAIESFQQYSWPGNVRELRNVIERLVITSQNDTLSCKEDYLVEGLSNIKFGLNQSDREKSIAFDGNLKDLLKRVEERYIDQVLAECDGRIGEAARRLGIHRTMLYRKIKEREK